MKTPANPTAITEAEACRRLAAAYSLLLQLAAKRRADNRTPTDANTDNRTPTDANTDHRDR